jgi:hypothetical protein
MKRNALALGASVLALALMAGPAAAQSGVGQDVDDSTGVLQVGAVAVDVPVRVASDGDSTTSGATAAGPQTTQDSTGAGQVGAVDADVPVRVLSDGDDAEPQAPAGGGEQSTDDSLGSAQVGAVDVAAPVRVASDGDNSSGSDAGDSSAGRQTVSDSNGAAQVGSPSLFAPVRVLSGEATPVDDLLETLLDSPSGGDDAVATPSAAGPTAGDAPQGRDWPSDGELRNLVDGPDPDAPFRFASGGASTEAGYAEALGVSAASLPLTGAEVASAAVLGLLLLTSGAGLRLVPGGRRH